MAAIGRKSAAGSLCLVIGLALAARLPLRADRAEDVRAQITYVASALAAGNPSDALTPFDKSMPGYEKLGQNFAALTDNFDVVSEVELGDEEDTDQESVLKGTWTLQVADKVNSSDIRRSYTVTIHLKSVRGKWKIVSFAPLTMFQVPMQSTGK